MLKLLLLLLLLLMPPIRDYLVGAEAADGALLSR